MRDTPLDFSSPDLGVIAPTVDSNPTQTAITRSTPGIRPKATTCPTPDLNFVATADLPGLIEEWLLECECRQHAATTNAVRRVFANNLLWFLRHRGFEQCGSRELKQFFLYLARGHEETGGRWGQGRFTKPLRPVSIKDYYACLRSFFGWMESEEIVALSPMARISRPPVRDEVKQPLSETQVEALLRAARLSQSPHRDEAIVLLLLDSGVRANELVQLKVSDLDIKNGNFFVIGKGNKRRSCYFGQATKKALLRYLRGARLAEDAALFPGTKDGGSGRALTRSGLLQLLGRLGRVAGIEVNVHQMRRTFATTILQNGSDIVAVRDMLGHSTIAMTLKYLSVSQSHIEAQHRQFSPADNLRRRR